MIQIVDLPKPHATFSFSSSALLKTHSLAKYEREGILKYFLKHYHRIEEGGRNLSDFLDPSLVEFCSLPK